MFEAFRKTSDGFFMNIEDGREFDEVDVSEAQEYNTIVKVVPSLEKRRKFLIHLETSHYAFSLHKSSTVRSLAEFYQLQAILKVKTALSLKD